MTNLHFMELHSPLFHGGKNHGLKLHSKEGVKLYFNEDKNWFEVSYNNRIAKIPMSSVQSWEEELAAPIVQLAPQSAPMDSRKIKTAQVSTPMGHVFEGEGAGKKNDRN